ncbi:peptidase, M28 family [Halobacteriovorax sp. BALOs_7]|uniref:M28 family peptidase n=1 Tax=Halobacteriovorax sp. BALOs_7 TaxID=2109558 RepID=UPI000EA36FEF|nr:M28 family peptidase [Halobacteriovorax sp. BALOs_7]AYF44368.1 peptidase, M28 family [Halobacteriovorax sp. BALOs_7]
MKYFILSIIFIITSNSYSQSYKLNKSKRSPERARKLYYSVSKFKEDYIENILTSFVKQTRPNRYVGTEGNKKAQKFILDYINKNVRKKNTSVKSIKFVPDIEYAKKMYQSDLDATKGKLTKSQLVKWERFTKEREAHLDKLKSTNGHNIVWEKKGIKKPNEVIVVGAHFDTAAYNKKKLEMIEGGVQPGADNNASGVVAALALIDILSELELEKTVRVVFFDFGELGFLGSYDYAKNLTLEKGIRVYSYVELLMLGYDTKTLDKEEKLGNMKLYYSTPSSSLHNLEKSIAQTFYAASSEGTFRVTFQTHSKNFLNGDNVSFQKMEIPSVVYTQNWESDFNGNRIHSRADHVSSINIKTLHHSTTNIAMAIASWALDL